ncbi:restriction endonuclease subunit S [Limosilactobacillus vaginalis]
MNVWEQRKLGEIANTFSGGTPSVSNKSYYNGDIPFIRSAEINKEKTELFLTQEGIANSSAKLVRKGTLLYALYGATSGEVGIAKINGAINQAIMAIEPKKDNSYFIKSWLIKNKEHIITTYLQGGQGNLSAKIIKSLSLGLPKVKEQFKVRDLITIVDYLIYLQQRKLEQLKQLKTAMLQQLLVSKKDGLIPNIRFKDFTETWEQRKLGDVATFSKGSGYSKSDLKSSGTPVILYGRLYTNYELVINSINTFTSAKNNSVYSKGGEVIVPASGETAKDISIASVVNKPNFLLGGDLNIIHPNKNIKSIFLAVSISNGETKKDMARRAQGKSIVHLHNTDLSQIKLAYPSEAEQEKIDSYFLKFDSLIALHQCKLNQLSKMKKFCLQKMFI